MKAIDGIGSTQSASFSPSSPLKEGFKQEHLIHKLSLQPQGSIVYTIIFNNSVANTSLSRALYNFIQNLSFQEQMMLRLEVPNYSNTFSAPIQNVQQPFTKERKTHIIIDEDPSCLQDNDVNSNPSSFNASWNNETRQELDNNEDMAPKTPASMINQFLSLACQSSAFWSQKIQNAVNPILSEENYKEGNSLSSHSTGASPSSLLSSSQDACFGENNRSKDFDSDPSIVYSFELDQSQTSLKTSNQVEASTHPPSHWKSKQDNLLLRHVKNLGCAWKKIAKLFNLKSVTPKFLKERYQLLQTRMPKKVRKSRFTHREDLILVKYYQIFGCDWEAVSQFLPGRAPNVVKNRFYSYIKKKKLLASLIAEAKETSSDIEVDPLGINDVESESNESMCEFLEPSKIDCQMLSKLSDKETLSTAQSLVDSNNLLQFENQPLQNNNCFNSFPPESFLEYEDTGIYLDLSNAGKFVSDSDDVLAPKTIFLEEPHHQESCENYLGNGNLIGDSEDNKYPPSPLLSENEDYPHKPSYVEQDDVLANEILMFQNLVEELKRGLDQLNQNQMS